MAKFKVDVEGVELVSARIRKIHGYKPMIRACVVKSLADMKNRSNQITPKDTGELRNSAFGNPIGDLEGEFGFNKMYAPFVEYGHRIVRGGRQVGFCPANPFLEPNARAQQPIFSSDCEKAIEMLVR